jgi:hypothetical protein
MPLAPERLQACSARLSADGRKIILGPGPAAWTEFCQSLPGARWSQFDCRWTCDFTPAAAWRIGYHGQTNRTYLSGTVVEAAGRFSQNIGVAQLHLQNKTLPPPPIHKTAPWSHQKTAYWFAHSLDAVLLAEEMGCGKSLTAVDLVVNWNCQTILILCPSSVRGVWRREIERHAGRPISVCVLEKGTTKDKVHVAKGALKMGAALRRPVAIILNYESAWRSEFAEFSLGMDWDAVICDECLPAGTPVATPDGCRPIEELRVGDHVWGIDHDSGMMVETTVKHTFSRRTAESLVEVNGAQMTPEHPVWTDRGYIPAKEVTTNDYICCLAEKSESHQSDARLRMVRTTVLGHQEGSEILRPIVRHEQFPLDARIEGSISGEHATNDSAARRSGQTTCAPSFRIQSVAQAGKSAEGAGQVAGDGVSDVERRKRNGSDATATDIGRPARLENGVPGKREAENAGTANDVQDRHCGADGETCGRSRRLQPFDEARSRNGREENGLPGIAGVDSPEIQEPRDNERLGIGGKNDHGNTPIRSDDCTVFNLETETGNFFAAGLLVHNSHRIKAHNSQISKYAAKLGRKAKRRLCLTGTPLAQSPLDLFGQFRFLDPGLFGTSWHHFSNRYAIKGNPYIPQQITGYKNQEELQERFRLISYRCKASDVLDLPEALHEERTCELSPAARKAYKEIEEELIADLGTGVVTASNALVRLLRLQQITSGFLVEDETEKIHRLDESKLTVLSDILEDIGGEPLVVFCRFRHDLEVVRTLAELKKLRYGELSGTSKGGLTDRGEMSPSIDVLGCQIQSGGVGIDLTRARYAVYYSLGFSLSEYEQSLARLHRPGQKRNVVYYHLIAENTVDRRVYSALRARKDVIEAVLGGFSSEQS